MKKDLCATGLLRNNVRIGLSCVFVAVATIIGCGVQGYEQTDCFTNDVHYDNGSTFFADCGTVCQCINGHFKCQSLCPEEEVLPEGCHDPVLVELKGQCCREWRCPGELCNKEDEFECPNGECLKKTLLCDGLQDCDDGSDEGDTLCAECRRGFRCKSGKCIRKQFICDKSNDCPDGDDEHEKACIIKPCAFYEFKCVSGECLWSEWECDYKKDCKDGSDEDPHKCAAPTIPTFYLDDHDHYVVKIFCEVRGYPVPQVKWVKDGKSFPYKPLVNTSVIDDKLFSVFSVLTLPRTALIYHNYTCLGINPAGKETKNVTVVYKADHPSVSIEENVFKIEEKVKRIKEVLKKNNETEEKI